MAWLKTAKSTDVETKTNSTMWGGTSSVSRPRATYNSNWDPHRAITEALERVTWVYRSVDAIASNFARQPLKVREGDRWDGETVESPLDRVLNSRANEGEDSYVFRYRLSAQVLLSRKGAFIEVIRDRGGQVTALVLLDPSSVEPVRDPQRFVKAYEVSIAGRNGGTPQKRTLKPEQVIWIRNPHPFDPYAASIPLTAIGMTIETDYYARLYNRNFLLNDGRPGGMVVLKGEISEDDQEAIQARFRGGPGGAGRTIVIAGGQGADFVDTAVTPRDAQYTDTRKITKEEILMGFGVPEPVIGNSAGRTYDNAEMERLIFWKETMLTHIEMITRPFDRILQENDEDLYLGVDLSRVDVLQRDEAKRREALRADVDAGVRSIDEFREAVGLKKLADGRGAVIFRPNTRVPYVTTDGSEVYMGEELPKPEGRPATAAGPNGTEDEPREREDDRTPELPNSTDKGVMLPLVKADVDTDIQKAAQRTDEAVERWIGTFEGVMKRYYDRQRKVVLEKLRGPKMRKFMQRRAKAMSEGVRQLPPSMSAKVAVETIYDQAVWDKQLSEDTGPLIEAIFKEFGEAVAEEFGVEYDIESLPVSAMKEEQIQRLKKVNDTTKDALLVALAAVALDESNLSEIADRVEETFKREGPIRARKAAITEVNGAAMASKALIAEEIAGSKKTWVTMRDDKVRLSHADMDGVTVGSADYFQVGSEKMLYPCDPSGSAQETVGCRCVLVVSHDGNTA